MTSKEKRTVMANRQASEFAEGRFHYLPAHGARLNPGIADLVWKLPIRKAIRTFDCAYCGAVISEGEWCDLRMDAEGRTGYWCRNCLGVSSHDLGNGDPQTCRICREYFASMSAVCPMCHGTGFVASVQSVPETAFGKMGAAVADVNEIWTVLNQPDATMDDAVAFEFAVLGLCRIVDTCGHHKAVVTEDMKHDMDVSYTG